MIAFDNRTAFIVIALLFLVLPIFAWITLAGQRGTAVALWCAGGLMAGGAFLLVGLRGRIPELASYTGANVLLMAGMMLCAQSLRLDLGIGWRAGSMALALVAYACSYESIQLWGEAGGLRLRSVYLLYLALAGVILHLSYLARRIAKRENSASAEWIARVCFLAGSTMLLRHYFIFTGTGSHVLAPSMVTQLFSISIMLAAVVGHMGYVGMALDRSLRSEIETVSALASDAVNRKLGGRIALLDRQRILGTVSASMGHELNQPLSAILTNAQVARRGLQKGTFDVRQAGEFLQKIISSAHRASQIIGRVRSLVVPSARAADAVDLGLAVHEVMELLAEDARVHNVGLLYAPPAQSIFVLGDAVQISQVILNLMRNAMEAMLDSVQREIHIDIQSRDDRVRLRVRDTGPGLVGQAQHQAGTPYFSTKTGGLGMGLSISRAIVEQFAGTLIIRNAGGGGALVEIEWPAWHVVAQARHDRVEDGSDGEHF